jgi:transcriptional regulator with PAS, ATPase and Fis domain
MNVQQIKQRFGIIGNAEKLDRAIEIAVQVAPTDLSVLITGESGTGKEVFPQIIHQFSSRKHGQYIAVNCGAIPEGTIDSELFGHEKGSFTGAYETRKGYFEVADKGTIFLDEVAELPLSTQVRLLRVLETGEFYKVGSSKVLKTNVRVVAATNVDVLKAIKEGNFREDLYYRLNTVPIVIPPLRERKDDIYLLFRKFAVDFAERYRMPAIVLDDEAVQMLSNYRWDGNIRQLKNITEQISVIEQVRQINIAVLRNYLPHHDIGTLPTLYRKSLDEQTFANEREILYKILFDMKQDMNDLKKLVHDVIQSDNLTTTNLRTDHEDLIERIYSNPVFNKPIIPTTEIIQKENEHITDTEVFIEESLSIADKEIELIQKALEKYKGKRKNAAHELGISERTLYRKIKEYNIDM